MKESSVDCKLNKYGNLIRLTKIKERQWTRKGHDYRTIEYFLNESTGQAYMGPDMREVSFHNDDLYCIFTIKLKKTSFKPINTRYPLITMERIKCKSGAFKRNTHVNKLIRYTENMKMVPELRHTLEHMRNIKPFIECLINNDKKIIKKIEGYFNDDEFK